MTNKYYLNEITKSEEDYLKAMFSLMSETEEDRVGNNQLAEYLSVSPASANNMVKKLKKKNLLLSERYGKLQLTPEGSEIAVWLIRKHRLWETFLSKYLNFKWDEVHEVAEQLEHIRSEKLTSELDRFMNFPKKDPHGEVIPDAAGNFRKEPKIMLSSLQVGDKCTVISVNDGSVEFLKYVSQLGLALSSEIEILEHREFDSSIKIKFERQTETVSKKFADNVFVQLA